MLNNLTMKRSITILLLAVYSPGKAKQTPVTDSCVVTCNDAMKADTVSANHVASPTIKLNKFANSYVKSYIKDNGKGLEKIKEQSKPGFKTIESIFIKYDIPVELKYLAVVESNMNSKATSRVGAKGYWQFMPSTAITYGLKVKGKVDERTHQYKSTVAAAKYLRSLYDDLGDWLLVVAAYNSGPGYIYKAIKQSGSRDFWKLQSFLPKETRNHVKRFISIHYFFEGEGSEATATKAEWNKYQKDLVTFAAVKTETVTPNTSAKRVISNEQK
ncbi:MAG: hypothetical protein EKK37_03105 [Sphingobacteriales bacterium]|nr:MAG: hypothetical protein EKK37_03105 [Sphingobacteriales bacterium]